jgi:hypothetical protein
MAQDNGATVQAVVQGRCTECDSHRDNYTVERRTFNMECIKRMLLCECGARATVTITDDELLTEGNITHEDASWN